MQSNNHKTCVITGCNTGIGKVTALELARQGFEIVMLVRDSDKSREAYEEIKAASPTGRAGPMSKPGRRTPGAGTVRGSRLPGGLHRLVVPVDKRPSPRPILLARRCLGRSLGGALRPLTTQATMLRNIHAVFSCTCMRWVSRSAVGSSLAASAAPMTERAVRATVS